MLRMQFAGRLRPLQRAPVELHDTSRGRRRCGAIQCTAYSQVSDQCCRRRVGHSVSQPVCQVSQSVSQSRAVPATDPVVIVGR